MGWDQPSDQSNGKTGAPTALEAQPSTPTNNENLHSLFIKDFLLPSDTVAPKPVTETTTTPVPPPAESVRITPVQNAVTESRSLSQSRDIPLSMSATAEVYRGPTGFNPSPSSYDNGAYPGAYQNLEPQRFEPQRYSAPQNFPPTNYGPQSFGPQDYPQGPPAGYPGADRFGPGPQAASGGRDMTYRGMVRQMLAQSAAERGLVPPGMNPGAFNPGGPNIPNDVMAGLREQRRPFQPQFVQHNNPPRPDLPPGAPQEQQRQGQARQGGLLRGLFRGADRNNGGDRNADRNNPRVNDQPPQPAKPEPMLKHEFLSKNETGAIKEIQLPKSFVEVPKDPAMAGFDPIQREFQIKGSRSHVSMYEGRELQPDEQKQFQAILSKPGKLQPDTPAYDQACVIMGSGYHTFVNDPQFTVGKFNGKDALFLTDSDPQQKLVGHTVLVPSDKGKFVYAISFDGNQADFPAVKQGFDSIKWRPTPDAVTPPAPKGKR